MLQLPRSAAVPAAAAVLILTSPPARAAVMIDWADPSISVTTADSQHATINGNTTGTLVVPFIITVSTATSTQDISFAAPLGATTPVLNLNLPATRQASTLMSVVLSIPGYKLNGTSFTLLDVDVSPSAASFADWQDKVVFLTAGVSMTSVDPTYTQVSGSTVLGINGNVANNANSGNVDVSFAGTVNSISYQYGPGPNDGLGNNQRHGVSNITITSLTPVPEPAMVLPVLLGAAAGVLWLRRRRTAE